ncbi:MAG: isoprenoid biosynthesis protein ElbB, partial [Nitrosopumilales archaeon CG11_big_fil_rev_8_21_14_0_20_33_24]
DIKNINTTELDALVLPGGFGVAKNLSTLAFEGPNGQMDEEVKQVILDIHQKNKPIGVICISPAVICLALGDKHPEVTIGNDPGTIEAIEAMGGKHVECGPSEAHIDSRLKLVSTPAYMYDDAPIFEISKGIDKCIEGVFSFL